MAGRLDDLKVPPGNLLGELKGSRKGQFSIRIDDQWRVCLTWTQAGPADVEIVDDRQEDVQETAKRAVLVPRVGDIVRGKRSVTADTDLRLCRFFGLSAG
ncbi:MAG: type II toxin-antitoxin system RelE/ParE family toxin, partial [Actinomycetales bacterium]